MKEIEQLLNFPWRRCCHATYEERYREVDSRANNTKGIWLDSEEPIRRHITQEARTGNKHDAFVLEDV